MPKPHFPSDAKNARKILDCAKGVKDPLERFAEAVSRELRAARIEVKNSGGSTEYCLTKFLDRVYRLENAIPAIAGVLHETSTNPTD
jgi:hypothetical protein